MMFWLFVLSFSGYASTESNNLLGKLEGVWFRDEYIQKLAQTKSPVQSASGLYELAIDIWKEKNTYSWMVTYNFHEWVTRGVGCIKEIPSKGYYEVKCVTNDFGIPEDVTYKIKVDNSLNPKKIEFFNEKKYIKFSKVDQSRISLYVNKVVLAGVYKDKKGKTYTFEDDMTAKWPEKQFQYVIGIDPVFQKDDYFTLIDKKGNYSNESYVFQWIDKKLLIYNAEQVFDSVEKKGKPILELTKVERHPWLFF